MISSTKYRSPLPARNLDQYWPALLCEEIGGNCAYSDQDGTLTFTARECQYVIHLEGVNLKQLESFRALVEVPEFRFAWHMIVRLRRQIAYENKLTSRSIHANVKLNFRKIGKELSRAITIYMHAMEKRNEKVCSACGTKYVRYPRSLSMRKAILHHPCRVLLCDDCSPSHTCTEDECGTYVMEKIRKTKHSRIEKIHTHTF